MWVKIDDGLHNHRKTREVTKSHATKARDIAPMGLWIVAAAWAGQNNTNGWVSEDELERWDSDWRELVARLVSAGYWWPREHKGEAGYGFNDWHDYNDPGDAASKAGTYGNHVRWHVNERKVEPNCQHCPEEPVEPEDAPEDLALIGGRSGSDSHPDSRDDLGHSSGGESGHVSPPIALPEPLPESEPQQHSVTDPGQPQVSDRKVRSAEADRLFDEVFWPVYPRKVKKQPSKKAFVKALRKTDLETIMAGLARAKPGWARSALHFTPHASAWLNAERWDDEPDDDESAETEEVGQVQRRLITMQCRNSEPHEKHRWDAGANEAQCWGVERR